MFSPPPLPDYTPTPRSNPSDRQGEEQKKLDVISNDVLKLALEFTGKMGVLASEEEDTPVEVDNTLDESYGTPPPLLSP